MLYLHPVLGQITCLRTKQAETSLFSPTRNFTHLLTIPTSTTITDQTTDVREVRPAWGRADDGSLLKIVNTKAFPQKIRMEVCRRAGEPCTFLAKAVRSSCRQRYSIHKMAAVDPRDPDGGVFLAAFKVPSGCFCHVRQGSSLFSGTSEDSPEDSPSASPLVQNLTQDLQALDGTFSSQGEKESDQAEDVTFITPGSFQFSGQPSSSLGQNVQNTPFRHLIGEESHLQSQFSTTTDQIQNLPSVTQSQSSSGTFETPFTTLSPPTSSFNPHPVTTIAPNPTFPPNQVISTFEQDFTNISNEVGSPGVSVTSQTDETVASHHIITKLDETVLDSSNSVQQSASEPTLSGDESKLHTVSDTFITTPFDLSPLRQNPTDGNYILSLRRVMDDGTEQPLDVVISVDGRLMGAVNHPAQAPSPITLQNLSNDQSLNLGLLFNELDQQTDVLRDKRHMNHMNDPNSTLYSAHTSMPLTLRSFRIITSKSLRETKGSVERQRMNNGAQRCAR
ncbi:Protein spaetzle [Penaeus vannamei]|uniref:Protein spaetzle n=1 Tax=Penaeus vannamei TaxID=6689 RepID=A0A423SCE6_PENVA|nr:Protein spaetzle [Penaeus vannamei]